jgi:THAP domain
MKEVCVVKGCRSRENMFHLPTESEKLKDWRRIVKEATGDDLNVQPEGKICIQHFEEKYICRYKASDSKLRTDLTLNAVPTLFSSPDGEDESTTVDSSELSSDPGKPKKRGTAGLQNLQKARMKRLLRKERMKNAGRRPKAKLEGDAITKRKQIDPEKDFFLGNRELTPAEKLVIPLRMTGLVRQLHDGSVLCKEPPLSTKDSKAFPMFNLIRRINGISNTNNPLEWSTQDTFHFIKQISPVKGAAKVFFAEEIDGEALLNLTATDIEKHLGFDRKISEELAEKFKELRNEVIQRFINI